MPWLRSEDSALKAKFQSLMVYDGNMPNGRPVPVRYRLPEDELANLSYPIIIIEHVDMPYASDRAHSGWIQLPYAPEGYVPWWNPQESPLTITPAESPYFSFVPTPYYFDYTVTVFARYMTQHAQPLVAQLCTEPYLPYQYGYLKVPQDGTVRTMLVEAGPSWNYTKDEDDKRLIAVTWRVRVFSELVQNVQTFEQYGGTLIPVNDIDINLDVYMDTMPIDLDTPAGIQRNLGIYSVGMPSQFNVQQGS